MYVEGAKTLRTNDSFICRFANGPVQIRSIVMGEKIRSLLVVQYMICLTSLGLQRNKHSKVFFQVIPNILQSYQFPIFCDYSFAKMFSKHLYLHIHLSWGPPCIPTKIPSTKMLQRRLHPRFVSESSAASARRDSMGRLRLRPAPPTATNSPKGS